MALPEASALWRGTLPPGPRLDVTVERGGRVRFEGETFAPLHVAHPFAAPVASGELTDADAAWLDLHDGVVDATGAVERQADGTSPVPLVIRADAATAWGRVVRVILACADPRVQVYRVFFVAQRGGEQGVLPWLLPRSVSGPTSDPQPRLSLRLIRRERGTPTAYTHVKLDRTREFVLPAAPDARRRALEALGTAIRDRLEGLGDRRSRVVAELDTPPPKGPYVPHGDVVAILGLLLAENVYVDATAAEVEADLGYRADGSEVVDSDVVAESFPWGHPGPDLPEVEPPESSKPVLAALEWLAAQQGDDGGWTDGNDEGGYGTGYDAGVTGLALSAFLAAGYTNRGNHPFKRTVSYGLRYLKNLQDPDGCIGLRRDTSWIYNHACASHALVQAYDLTRSPIYKGAAQRALAFIERCRNPDAVWRYGVRPGDNDTAVTGFMLLPLLDARDVNEDRRARDRAPLLELPDPGFDAAAAWLDRVTDRETGRVGYTTRSSGLSRTPAQLRSWPREKSEALTALGLLLRLRLGSPDEAVVARMRALVLAQRPDWNDAASVDLVFWRFAAAALSRSDGDQERAWLDALRSTLIDGQQDGAWEPIGPWGADGGPVYATSMATICLATIDRRLR